MNCFELLKRTLREGNGIMLSSLYFYYHPNGQLWEKSYWEDGNKHGKYLLWSKNGQLWERSYYRNGRIYGKRLIYKH